MRLAFLYLKLVVEPGGATALAALASGKFDGRGKTVARGRLGRQRRSRDLLRRPRTRRRLI